MIRVKNTSHTLFRWQEFIWRPGEIITFNKEGFNLWEENMARQIMAAHKNLVEVADTPTKEDLKQMRIANLAKAREARKAKREQSNHTS